MHFGSEYRKTRHRKRNKHEDKNDAEMEDVTPSSIYSGRHQTQSRLRRKTLEQTKDRHDQIKDGITFHLAGRINSFLER